MKEISEIINAVFKFGPDDKAVLATVVDVKGSGYRLPGARMLILADGQTIGTVSGGCLEADVMERAKKVIASGETETFTYDTTDDETSVFSLNMGCRGIVDIRLEPVGKFSPVIGKMRSAYEDRVANDEFDIPVAVKLFGAGADAVPFVRIASELGWQVTVHDHRPAFLTAERFPAAHMLVDQLADDQLSDLETDDRTAIVIMTHSYSRDRTIVPAILRSEAFYVGALGPKRRTEQLLGEIDQQFKTEQLERLYAPAGLDIGADTPESIALSIIGEIQSVLAKRSGGNLRNRPGSIYDRK